LPQRPIKERYEVLEELGRGGFGVVFKAKQLATGQWVAIKKLHVNEPLSSPRMRSRQRRFWREIQLIGKLHSPFTVRLVDAGVDEGQPYMVLEFIEGRPLADLLRLQPLSPALTKRLMCQVLEAVTEAHQRGIVHRDLKPSNIMVTGQDDLLTAKVLDFGIAGLSVEDSHSIIQVVTETGQVRGTPGYMAPEQIQETGARYPQIDVYALGLILLECLTGQPAVRGASLMDMCFNQLNTPLEVPVAVKASAFGPIIRRASAKDRLARFSDAAAMLRALRDVDASTLSLSLETGSWNTTDVGQLREALIPTATVDQKKVALPVAKPLHTRHHPLHMPMGPDVSLAVPAPRDGTTLPEAAPAVEVTPPQEAGAASPDPTRRWFPLLGLLAVAGGALALALMLATVGEPMEDTPSEGVSKQATLAPERGAPSPAADAAGNDAAREIERRLALSQAAQAEENFVAARAHLEAVLALDPGHGYAGESLGWVLLQLEDFKAAIGAFEAVEETRLTSVVIGLARAHRGAGNHGAARSYFEQYLRLYPAGPFVAEAKAALASLP